MKTFIKTALVALSLAAAGLTVSAPAASAADARLTITVDSGRHHDMWSVAGRHDRHRDRHWGRHDGRCSVERALNKARDMGLRRARVTEVNRRFVEVSGRRHGGHGRVVFANQSRCPVVAVR
jgi:hypothetical protein